MDREPKEARVNATTALSDVVCSTFSAANTRSDMIKSKRRVSVGVAVHRCFPPLSKQLLMLRRIVHFLASYDRVIHPSFGV